MRFLAISAPVVLALISWAFYTQYYDLRRNYDVIEDVANNDAEEELAIKHAMTPEQKSEIIAALRAKGGKREVFAADFLEGTTIGD